MPQLFKPYKCKCKIAHHAMKCYLTLGGRAYALEDLSRDPKTPRLLAYTSTQGTSFWTAAAAAYDIFTASDLAVQAVFLSH